MVRSGDVGQQINNSATAEIKSGTGAGKITRSSNVRVLVEAPEPETATLRFEFKSGTDGKDLPASDMPPVPNDVTEEVGTAVQLTNYTETVNDEGNKGKWTFGGWFENESLTQATAIRFPKAARRSTASGPSKRTSPRSPRRAIPLSITGRMPTAIIRISRIIQEPRQMPVFP